MHGHIFCRRRKPLLRRRLEKHWHHSEFENASALQLFSDITESGADVLADCAENRFVTKICYRETSWRQNK